MNGLGFTRIPLATVWGRDCGPEAGRPVRRLLLSSRVEGMMTGTKGLGVVRRDRSGVCFEARARRTWSRVACGQRAGASPRRSWLQHHGQRQHQTRGKPWLAQVPIKQTASPWVLTGASSVKCWSLPLDFVIHFSFSQICLFLGTAANPFWDEAGLNAII